MSEIKPRMWHCSILSADLFHILRYNEFVNVLADSFYVSFPQRSPYTVTPLTTSPETRHCMQEATAGQSCGMPYPVWSITFGLHYLNTSSCPMPCWLSLESCTFPLWAGNFWLLRGSLQSSISCFKRLITAIIELLRVEPRRLRSRSNPKDLA